ncbi:hypothetical protein DEO72_LG3g1411 [Vigna unguiculata]|uniref:Uncharacterized protein n=1 Tax=Vigna unguiculata TaxID=3917 RepID=A0A4D6LE52_VIGUN|nr:hypothetical protein DEO72_LG3g1411 [Vigna unguiculata]
MATTMLIMFYLITEEGNLSGSIRNGHNQHTHTDNTRQPELNSRVPRVHLPSRARLEGCHSEINSRNVTCLTPIPSSTQEIRSEPQRKEQRQALPASRPPGREYVPPSANAPLMPMLAVIAWRNTPHRQAPRVPVAIVTVLCVVARNVSLESVSYTRLDVYKRQLLFFALWLGTYLLSLSLIHV